MKTALLILLLAAQLPGDRPAPPPGWRYPGEADYDFDWQEFRQSNPVPFYAAADFNGDGAKDHAALLIPTVGKGWGLFVFLAETGGKYRPMRLERDEGRTAIQRMGLGIVDAGTHQTACGKGYGACAPGEPTTLRLKHPGLSLFVFESGGSVFWWDPGSRSFKQTWLSD